MSEEFWIGDPVEIISTGTPGKIVRYAKNGAPVILTDDGEVEASWDDVRARDENTISLAPETHVEIEEVVIKPFDPVIDLHIDKLRQDHKNMESSEILRYQLLVCRDFLDRAILNKTDEVTIIHGKGEGILKDEVHLLLGEMDEVFNFGVDEFKYKGGATRVFFHYKRR